MQGWPWGVIIKWLLQSRGVLLFSVYGISKERHCNEDQRGVRNFKIK